MRYIAPPSIAVLPAVAFVLSGSMATKSTAQSPSPPTNGERVEVTLEGQQPLRPLPFQLRLDGGMPESPRDMVERLYEAIPPDHLDKIAAYYGHPGYEDGLRQYGNQRLFFESLYIREIVEAAFDAWNYTGREVPLAAQLRCIGPTFVEQVGLQLGVMAIYFRQEGPIRIHSEVTRAYTRADMISRSLFDSCERRSALNGSSGAGRRGDRGARAVHTIGRNPTTMDRVNRRDVPLVDDEPRDTRSNARGRQIRDEGPQ